MQIGTAGAAYGPGFQISRPTMGSGMPLTVGSNDRAGFVRRSRIMPLLPRGFDIGVHQNELANRVAALQIVRHPILAGTDVKTSPLMAAHAALSGPVPAQSPIPAPPPLMALPSADVVDRLKRAMLARRA